MAITDIFSRRYEGVQLREAWSAGDFAFMTQAHLMLRNLFYSDSNYEKINAAAEALYQRVNDKVAIELGMEHLVKHTWIDRIGQTHRFSYSHIVKEYLVRPPTGDNPDYDIKSRLSVVEQGFKEEWLRVQSNNANLDSELAKARVSDAGRGSFMVSRAPAPPRSLASLHGGSPYAAKTVQKAVETIEETAARARQELSTVLQDGIRKANKALNDNWEKTVEELNQRLRINGYNLHFHNGILQFRSNELIEEEIHEPFWDLVSHPMFKSVNDQMLEALDRRDRADRTAPFHAVSALESVIKIICKEKGWARGKEYGATQFITNLVSKDNGRFIEVWEGDMLTKLFGDVRNPFGHGPGNADLPKLSDAQVDWTIDTAMAWSKSLIMRM